MAICPTVDFILLHRDVDKLWQKSHDPLPKNGAIPAFWQFDLYGVILSFILVVLRQLVAQPSRFGPHHCIGPRVEGFFLSEHLNGHHVLFELFPLASDCLIDDEAQESAKLRGVYEWGAIQNAFELNGNCLRAGPI